MVLLFDLKQTEQERKHNAKTYEDKAEGFDYGNNCGKAQSTFVSFPDQWISKYMCDLEIQQIFVWIYWFRNIKIFKYIKKNI